MPPETESETQLSDRNQKIPLSLPTPRQGRQSWGHV